MWDYYQNNSYTNELDVLYSITRMTDFACASQDKLSVHNFKKTGDPVISLLILVILKKKPDERIIRGGIKIFREEKNAKNKRALFCMLYHFLNPFSGLMSFKMTYD
jgi:hypothetical protein